MIRFFALLFLLLSGGNTHAGVFLAQNDPSYDSLAIQHRGRVKPFFGFTQEMTASLTGRTTVSLPEHGRLGSREFILSLWQHPEGWEDEPIILIDHAALRKEIGLEGKERFYSFRRLSSLPRLGQLAAEADAARASGTAATVSPLASAAQTVRIRLAIFSSLRSGDAFRMIPPPTGSRPEAAWGPAAFQPADSLHQLQSRGAFSTGKLRAESFYFNFHPFRWAWVAWLLSAVCLLFAERTASGPGRRLGGLLALAGFVLLVGGFGLRVWLAGRPPVTNMYESIL